jgi:hypothetical protein
MYGEIICEYVQCNVCTVVSYTAVVLCLQWTNIEASDVRKTAEYSGKNGQSFETREFVHSFVGEILSLV